MSFLLHHKQRIFGTRPSSKLHLNIFDSFFEGECRGDIFRVVSVSLNHKCKYLTIKSWMTLILGKETVVTVAVMMMKKVTSGDPPPHPPSLLTLSSPKYTQSRYWLGVHLCSFPWVSSWINVNGMIHISFNTKSMYHTCPNRVYCKQRSQLRNSAAFSVQQNKIFLWEQNIWQWSREIRRTLIMMKRIILMILEN